MVKIIAGLMGSSVQSGFGKSTPDQTRLFLNTLKDHNVREVDTARVYNAGKSEEDLGAVPTAKIDFAIATKAPGFSPGSLTYDKVTTACNASLTALKQEKLDLYYFHGPDRQTPLSDSLRAINDLHTAGKFTRFGISNFTAAEVTEIHDHCSSNGYVLPTVYQGGYNPLGRTSEKELFPTLRKLGMAFYAYSPLAGGYFSRPTSQLRSPPQAGSRMEQMKVFASMYVNETSLGLHEELTQVCEKEGLTVKEATLRWFMHHSILGEEDGVILGASSREQMEENLIACEGGPLPSSVVTAFEGLYKKFNAGNGGPLPYSI